MTWRLLTPEEAAAYEADPRTVEWRKQQDRAARNARAHCGCGRFVRVTGLTYIGDGLTTTCSRCGPVIL